MSCTSRAEAEAAAAINDSAIGEGFARALGCRVVEWAPGRVEVELALGPQHLNRAGSVHGGVLATLIDVACTLAGLYSGSPERVRKAVTLSLNTSFTGQVATGTLRARGRVRVGGRSIFFATTEVTDAAGHAIAHGETVNRYRRGSEEADGASPEEPTDEVNA
ncbi:PaaI family thioesterase [Aromatoleum evansii]|uniref:PaaI family thioesterase n=1 Tax=Aromatoleum evansii TaxID=59406 RepID=A0ABZ1ATK3_AROEV|nr:PaaI family thioesterase [Aromatoleum toluclasticum]MBD5803208.1 Thioesterase superfamily protein [Azoarcus sp. Aa7]WRL48785.1 PaaI family thioesterase [Aromatoleum evansii]